MNAIEALTRLIALAEESLKLNSSLGDEEPEFSEHEGHLATATAICQAMLNTALPIARFRVFVEIDEIPGKQDSLSFTVCALTIDDIKAALYYAGIKTPVTLQATLWEQKAAGVEMLSGYRGTTGAQFTKWILSLQGFQDGVLIDASGKA